MQLMQGDCLELMKQIPDGSIDMILCDLPYGTTDCKWDSVIPIDVLWNEYRRIIKSNGVIALFGSEPFSSKLRTNALDLYKYDWVWVKNSSAGFPHAKNMPLKKHENICVFSTGSMGHANLLHEKRMTYNPQGIIRIDKQQKNGKMRYRNVVGQRPSHKDLFVQEYTNYPNSVLYYNKDGNIHPTQKPVALLEYLIKTYTNEGETVLDNCMGSGSTGVACVNTRRDFIGIELDKGYFEIAKKRIEDASEAVNNG